MTDEGYEDLVALETDRPIWERFFTVAPLVVIGTREESGEPDLAPKHMVGPVSWENYFGFVCSPGHSTYVNARREACFTVSFPSCEQVVLASLTASPRCEDGSKAALRALPTMAARKVVGVFLRDSYLCLECRLHRVVDDLGPNSLVVGRVVAACVRRDALRRQQRDDQDVIADRPLLAYLNPGRFAEIRESQGFPFPAGFKR